MPSGQALLREPDGGLLVAGCVDSGAFAVARFTATGAPDTAFGDQGRATIAFGGPSACAYAAAYDAHSGGTVIGGTAALTAGDKEFALTKLRRQDIAPNSPPIGQFDFYRIAQDTVLEPAAPGVLENDIDQDGDPLSATLITAPNYGTLTLAADGAFRYAPGPGFSGQDLFTYRADDGRDASDTTTVLISVVPTAGNRVPQAQRNGYDTLQDTRLYVPWPGVLDNDSDADNDTLVAELVTAPAHGTLELRSDGAYTYIPDEGFVGEDHFRYRINDGVDFSEPTDITLRVQAEDTNVPPIAVGDRFATPSDTPLDVGAPGVLGNDLDMNGDDLTVALVEQAARGTVTLNSDGTFVYTPDAGFTGLDQFTYAVSDGTHTKQTTVVIAVGTISDEPGDNPGDEPNPAPDDGQPAIYLPLIIR